MNRLTRRTTFTLLLLCGAFAMSVQMNVRSQIQGGPAKEVQAIRATLDQLAQADTAGDLNAVLALYAGDAILMPPNKPLIVGKDKIEAHYAALFGQTRLDVKILSDEIQASGRWGFVRGVTQVTATPRQGGPPVQAGGKYLMVMHRDESGKWKVARLFWDTGDK